MWNDFTDQPGFRRWFEWNVRVTVRKVRFDQKNEPWLRQALTDKEVVESVVSYFAERAESFIHPGDWAWISDLATDGDFHVEYNEDRVLRRIANATEKAQEAVEVQCETRRAERDAQEYSDLDQWLEALDAGELEAKGPNEPDGERLVDGSFWDFRKAARQRRNSWPRRCRVCDALFRPKPANVKSCSPCIDKMRAEREAKRRAERG